MVEHQIRTANQIRRSFKNGQSIVFVTVYCVALKYDTFYLKSNCVYHINLGNAYILVLSYRSNGICILSPRQGKPW